MSFVRAEKAVEILVPFLGKGEVGEIVQALNLQNSLVDGGLLFGVHAGVGAASGSLVWSTSTGDLKFDFDVLGVGAGSISRSSNFGGFSVDRKVDVDSGSTELGLTAPLRVGKKSLPVAISRAQDKYGAELITIKVKQPGAGALVGGELLIQTKSQLRERFIDAAKETAGLGVGGSRYGDTVYETRVVAAAETIIDIALETDGAVSPEAVVNNLEAIEQGTDIRVSTDGRHSRIIIDGTVKNSQGSAIGSSVSGADSAGNFFDEGIGELYEEEFRDASDAGLPVSCFAAGTLVETPGGGPSRIEELNLNDTVLAFSSVTGGLEPARVTQIHETPDQPVIDFHGTAVTPGHVYACPDGEYRQLGAVMMADGYVVAADGGIVRARTGEAVSPESFALRQAMFGPSGVPAFEGAVDRAGPDSPPPVAAGRPQTISSSSNSGSSSSWPSICPMRPSARGAEPTSAM